MLLALAIYTIYAFLQRKPNAVYLAKVYIAAVFISNVITLFSGEFEESGMGSYTFFDMEYRLVLVSDNF